MADIAYANVVFKDAAGNTGHIKTLTAADITRIQNTIQGLKDLKDRVDVIIDNDGAFLAATEATDTVLGTVKKASAADVTAGTVGKVVDAAQLKAVADKLTNGVHYKGTVATFDALPTTDVEAGDMYNVTAAFTKDGINYPAGTNVIADTSGASVEWDVLDGDPSGFAKQAVANTFTAANTFNNNVTVAAASGGATPAVDLTGADVTVATQSAGDNSTKAASTAYVDAAVANVVQYSASAPVLADLDNNTATFYQATDLLSDPT